MIDIRAAASALGGSVAGRNTVTCPGPGHSRGDRSLSVTFKDSDVIIVHSFAGDDWRACKDYVLGRLGLSRGQPARRPTMRERRWEEWSSSGNAPEERILRARALWDQGIDPRGTVAEDYLRSRSIPLTGDVAALRFHPRCPWNDDAYPEYPAGRHPTLLAAFRHLATDKIVAVHRMRLDRPDLWPKTRRAMLGPVRLAAVKLAAVADTLAIAEGIETAMAATVLGHGPAWALGSVGAVERLPVLPGISRLILLQENNDASRRAVQRCGQRWLRAGRGVTRVWPVEGCDDLNDELISRGNL